MGDFNPPPLAALLTGGNMEAEHTQGPLTVVEDFVVAGTSGRNIALVRVGDAELQKLSAIALTGSAHDAERLGLSLADARRLAACWNACEGVSTEDLEGDYEQEIPALVVSELRRQLAEAEGRAGQAYAARDERARRVVTVMEEHQAAMRKLRGQLVDAMQGAQEARDELNALESRAQAVVGRNYLLTAALQRVKQDTMHARRFGAETLQNYRSACVTAEAVAEDALATSGTKTEGGAA